MHNQSKEENENHFKTKGEPGMLNEMIKIKFPYIVFFLVSLIPFWVNVSGVSTDAVLNLRDFDTPFEIDYDLYVRFFTWYSYWGLGLPNSSAFLLLDKSLVFSLLDLFHLPLIYIEKIYLTGVLFLLGCGSYYFITNYFNLKGTNGRMAGLFGALFYMLSIPVYTRLIGVPHILISIALWPVLFVLILKVIHSNNLKVLLRYSICFALVSLFALSADLTLNLIYCPSIALFVLLHIIIDRKKLDFKLVTAGIGFVSVFTFLVNIWWMTPILEGIFGSGALVKGNIAHPHNIEVFQASNNLVNFFDNIRLHWTKQGFSLLAPDGTPYFTPAYIKGYYNTVFSYLLFLIFLGSAIFISFKNKDNKKQVLVITLLGLVATFFSLGTHFPILGRIHEFLFYNMPGFQALRNFYKFQYIILIWYAVLATLLCNYLFCKYGTSKRNMAAIISVLIIFITLNGLPFTAKNLAGRHEHFKVPDYYMKARAWLKSQYKDIYRTLVMPQGTWEETYEWGPKFELVPIHRNFFKDSILLLQEPDDVKKIIEPIEEFEVKNLKEYLKLLNVRYVLIRKDIHKPNLTEKNEKLIKRLPEALEAQGIKLEKSFGKLDLYKIPDEYFLPLIYPASTIPIVSSGVNSLIALSYMPNDGGYPVRAFTDQQNTDGLESLVIAKNKGVKSQGANPGGGGGGQWLDNTQILFANTGFNDLVIDMARAGLEGTGQKEPEVVSIRPDFKGRGKFKVGESGVYEIWLKAEDFADKLKGIKIGGARFLVKKEGKDKWIKIGAKEFKKGSHKIALNWQGTREELKKLTLSLEVVLVSERKRNEYGGLLKSKDAGYLFYKELDGASGIISKRYFYIPRGGEYEVKALLRPKKEQIKAYALNERFTDEKFGGGNFEFVEVGAGYQNSTFYNSKTEVKAPACLFADNFYPPETLSYPLNDTVWRWMSNDGKILIFSPFNAPVNVNITFSLASFKNKKEVRMFLDNKHVKTLTIPGKANLPDIMGIGRFSEYLKPQRVELSDVRLRPGINELLLESVPSATFIRKEKRLLSIAVSDDLGVRLSGSLPDVTSWDNGKEFKGKLTKKGLVLEDNYRFKKDEVAWVAGLMGNVNLYKYPLFILEYSWADNLIQAMEVGFRIDSNGDGKEDIYFSRTLPDSRPSNINRFELDLLEEVWKIFPDLTSAFLIGIDLFPHKRWGLDISDSIKGGMYSYYIKGIYLASKEASATVLYSDSFEGLKLPEEIVSRFSNDNKGLTISLPLNGRTGVYSSTEFSMPVRKEFLKKASLLLLPFNVSDKEGQRISVWRGYDTSGDGKADRFLPLGRKVPLFNWSRLTKDMGAKVFMYETMLPGDYLDEYTTEGKVFNDIVVLKDGKPLIPTWNHEFLIFKEQVQVDGKRVVINLPRDEDPGDYRYDLYYLPKEWIKESPRFPGFMEYVFELWELGEPLSGVSSMPVELKFSLEERLSENPEKEKVNDFYLKAPLYINTVLPKIKNIQEDKNMPRLTMDYEEIDFNEIRVDKEEDGIWLATKLWLEEGEHRLSVNEPGALGAYLVEARPQRAGGKKVNEAPKVEFKKINPTRYIVDVKGSKGPFTLVFGESFHGGWHAYIRGTTQGREEPWSALWSAWRDRGKRVEIDDHFVVNGYANGWSVPGGRGEDLQIVLEYKPQMLFEAGLLISGATLFGCMGYLAYRRKDGIGENQ